MAQRGRRPARAGPAHPGELDRKPPSAELRPGQLDSDSLPDYAVLDAILDDYIVEDHGRGGARRRRARPSAGGPGGRGWWISAEYKRRQYPPGPKITPRNFGRDRRLPITNRWREPRVG